MVELAIQIKSVKAIRIKAPVTPQTTGPLKMMLIWPKNQVRTQKDYLLADTLPNHVETHTLGLLIRNGYYYDIFLDVPNKIQDILYFINLKQWERKYCVCNDTTVHPANDSHLITTKRESTLFEIIIEELWN